MRLRRLQRQRLEQRPKVTVRRAKRDRLQRLRQGRCIALRASGKRGPGGGPVVQQGAVRRQAGEQRVRRDQRRRSELGLRQRLRLGRQFVDCGQQVQRLRHLPAFQQPCHVGPAQQRHIADIGAGAPERQRLLDHVFGRQLLGPAGIGCGQPGQPRAAPLALEQLFELLDRLLVARSSQGRLRRPLQRRTGDAHRHDGCWLCFFFVRHGQRSGQTPCDPPSGIQPSTTVRILHNGIGRAEGWFGGGQLRPDSQSFGTGRSGDERQPWPQRSQLTQHGR